jgi:hypothetical protein
LPIGAKCMRPKAGALPMGYAEEYLLQRISIRRIQESERKHTS